MVGAADGSGVVGYEVGSAEGAAVGSGDEVGLGVGRAVGSGAAATATYRPLPVSQVRLPPSYLGEATASVSESWLC